ncbi:DUF599 domain-containing protein [Cucumibacter marinus]|uniref:DUF599 domain-containing protein n=1 Tax=Cucumibacter marinus TaxID=1121252 RepID=UPI00040E909F|nr:DUF599 domain-containing protein [Cucumibacter marinus]
MNWFALFSSALPLIALYLYGLAASVLDAWRPSLSELMNARRIEWVYQASRRDTPLDGILSGNIMSSVSFFASTTALLILALFTVIGQLPQFAPAISTITFGTHYSETDLQLHNILMLVLFVSAFLAFTLALRQFNHFCILLGALDHRDPATPEHVEAIARINAIAAGRFNAGIRAYYFAIPMVAWFVSSWAAIAVTAATIFMLLHREYFSRARKVVADMPAQAPHKQGRSE